jgi:DNA-binding transcriptional MerR regulator
MLGPSEAGHTYKVHEFATLAGVTVRALHHYDRLGLLKPRRTTRAYRVYRDADLPRVQQIIVLKFLGLPLGRIADALKNESRLDDLLKTRRYVIRRKREQLAIGLHMLDELEGKGAPQRDWADLASLVHEIGGSSAQEGSRKRHQLDEARRLIGERRMAWKAELPDYELTRDVRAAIARGDTPDTPAGQALVARWRDAIERFSGGDSRLREALALVMSELKIPEPEGMAGFHEYFNRAFQQAS